MDKKGSHGTADVVRIRAEVTEGNPHGYVEINADDFDKDKHELFDAPADVDYASLTKAKLATLLSDAGVEFDPSAKKDDLIALAVKHLQ